MQNIPVTVPATLSALDSNQCRRVLEAPRIPPTGFIAAFTTRLSPENPSETSKKQVSMTRRHYLIYLADSHRPRDKNIAEKKLRNCLSLGNSSQLL